MMLKLMFIFQDSRGQLEARLRSVAAGMTS